MSTNIDVFLFDLGGVLIELGDELIPASWMPGDEKFEHADWFSSPTALLFEKGLVDAKEFAEALKKDLALDVSTQRIIEQFTAWPIGTFSGVDELLLSIKGKFRLAVLSNTNQLHWPRIINEFGVIHHFERVFASHLLQMAKPAVDIFEHVIDELGVKPENILFLDDNQKNIEAAKQLEMQGILVSGIQELKSVVTKFALA